MTKQNGRVDNQGTLSFVVLVCCDIDEMLIFTRLPAACSLSASRILLASSSYDQRNINIDRGTIGLTHDDVLLISFTTKPRIQNANVFPEDRN